MFPHFRIIFKQFGDHLTFYLMSSSPKNLTLSDPLLSDCFNTSENIPISPSFTLCSELITKCWPW